MRLAGGSAGGRVAGDDPAAHVDAVARVGQLSVERQAARGQQGVDTRVDRVEVGCAAKPGLVEIGGRVPEGEPDTGVAADRPIDAEGELGQVEAVAIAAGPEIL